MTTDRKMPERHYYIVPSDITPEKLLSILYTKPYSLFRIDFCKRCVSFLNEHGMCYVVNENDCYYFVKNALKIPPECNKQWFPTTIGEL